MRHERLPVALLSIMFLTIGVMFCMNDILLPIVKEMFSLTYVEATLIQVSFYIVYLIWPLPIAASIARFGYRKNIIACMVICLLGCLLFIPAHYAKSYALILFGVFTISTGVTVANVAANPYATLLGTPDGAHARLNFVQAFSRVGYAMTPLVASMLIFSSGNSAAQIHIPYLALAFLIGVVIVLMTVLRLPDYTPAPFERTSVLALLNTTRSFQNLFLGVPAMFFYVGAEACTSGFFISYMTSRGYNHDMAATFLTFYYVLAAAFALLGAFLLKYISPGTLLSVFGIGMISCFVLVMLGADSVGPYALVAAGGFLSVMFPTIFSLAIENLRDYTEKGSALLNFAIVGGAAFPPLQGWIADSHNVQLSYAVPACCIIVVTAYGFSTRFAPHQKKLQE